MSGKNAVIKPVSTSGTIPRLPLTQKLKQKSAKKNIFLTAPGGYGKTVAAAQWLGAVRGATARIIAGYVDNDPGVFYSRLASTLLRLTGNENTATIPASALTLEGLLEVLRPLPERAARCYFLIDDMHMIKNEQLLGSLPLIVSRLPAYICLCIVSRAEPSAALLQTGRFEVITKDDLIFTPEETEWLCAEKDRQMTEEQIGELLETTGGWAMYLSALLSGESLDTAGDGVAPRSLQQYLDERVWGLWDDETKGTLARLAVPVEVTPELCERLVGRGDGRDTLDRLVKIENAFLSPINDDTYRFHDVFRDFLLERADKYLGGDELRRLRDIAAEWYYEQGDYYTGAQHYIQNKDHEGINRCMRATNRFHEETSSISVEARLHFIKQYVINLPADFIAENPYLLSKCAVVAFHDGDAEGFHLYTDLLYQKLPDVSDKYPDLAENAVYVAALDFRKPLRDYAVKIAGLPTGAGETESPEVRSVTITQNLPFFHRSMRDYSEYYELRDVDLNMYRAAGGVMLGKDRDVMIDLLLAGIYYERGELLEAIYRAMSSYRLCDEANHPETFFCVHMILSVVLYAMGAAKDAGRIMKRTEVFIEGKARFLHANFKALQTERAIRAGDSSAAEEWLEIYANRSERLPFYQMCRHFTTLRSYIAVHDYAAAIEFGSRLQTLAAEYNRPLDQIESGLLTAIALRQGGEINKAIRQLEQVVNIAMPYGFTQLFINEGKDILPILWKLQERTGKTTVFMQFVDKLTDDIYAEHDLEPENEQPPHLSEQQRVMLTYLNTGKSYSEIAETLGVGRGTVKSHVYLLYKRLDVHNAQEAIVKAKMLGILD